MKNLNRFLMVPVFLAVSNFVSSVKACHQKGFPYTFKFKPGLVVHGFCHVECLQVITDAFMQHLSLANVPTWTSDATTATTKAIKNINKVDYAEEEGGACFTDASDDEEGSDTCTCNGLIMIMRWNPDKDKSDQGPNDTFLDTRDRLGGMFMDKRNRIEGSTNPFRVWEPWTKQTGVHCREQSHSCKCNTLGDVIGGRDGFGAGCPRFTFEQAVRKNHQT